MYTAVCAVADTFTYDTNNRLVTYNGNTVTYDLDGNMTDDGVCPYTYDSANRLTSFGGHTYTYRSDDIRIRDLCADEDTTYTYDTNCKLSKLLTKTTNGTTTKYVYGRGLVSEETNGNVSVYHFDSRGSTVALTDASGNITDTFAYDTYGKLIEHIGNSSVIFLYNGRDGVITEDTGLCYMRARYYSPDMRRFINADIVAGQISNAVTLNRFAYANGNPVSFVDPFGLSAERGGGFWNSLIIFFENDTHKINGKSINNGWYVQGSVSGGNNSGEFWDGAEYEIKPKPNEDGDSFTGINNGISVVNANGSMGYTNGIIDVSLGADVDLLEASVAAGVAHGEEKGIKLGGGAAVASGEVGLAFEIFGFGFELGLSGEFLSAKAEVNAGVVKKHGKRKISFGADIGALLFGAGFDIALIIPY